MNREPTRPWVAELRAFHDQYFSFDWRRHLSSLNASLELNGRDAFGLPEGLPPAWFVGDVDALDRGGWVLVLSLNQARREEDDDWHQSQSYTSQSYWDHWRWLNRDWWEPRFYRPLVRLAAGALGAAVEPAEEARFATSRMIFAELCPYPSRQFSLSDQSLIRLADQDIGFQTAAEVRRVLIEVAEPALILVNGVASIAGLRSIEGARTQLTTVRYPSVGRPAKELWHQEGSYTATGRSVPVVAFPFLRKPRTHNSYVEIDQLAAHARDLLAP